MNLEKRKWCLSQKKISRVHMVMVSNCSVIFNHVEDRDAEYTITIIEQYIELKFRKLVRTYENQQIKGN
jgi:hypothetical protein